MSSKRKQERAALKLDLPLEVYKALSQEEDHDETTCMICYQDFYGRVPENPEDFKYGKGRI